MSTNEPSVSHRKTVAGSDRSFGLVFAAVFLLIGLFPSLHGGSVRLWAIALASVFVAAAFSVPHVLSPLNRLWLRFGLLLHHVVSPVLMAVLYYGAVVPTGLLVRAFGKDLLRLRRDPELTSYWVVREPPGPPQGTMSKQF